MELVGKKINFLGDSITQGHGTTGPGKNYVSVFGRLSGAKVRNYGLGGTRIARQSKPSECADFDRDFNMRADEMDSDADVIVVFGGTNDFGHGDAAIGDFMSRDVYTFYGAMHVLCEKLINKYPRAEIVFLTPIHRMNEDADNGRTGLYGYVDIIKEVARYYALPVLDLYSMSRLQPNVPEIRDMYFADDIHPSDAGAELIAKRLLGFLSAL